MPTIDDVITDATAGLDDDLKPLETDKKAEKAEAAAEAQDESKDKQADEDAAGDKKPEEDADDFTAADVTAPPADAPTTKVETAPVDTSGLSDEGKYIVDNLPSLVARIKDGDNIKELQVKSWTQLPEDVTFASKRDELAFMNALTAQENRAQVLQNQFRNQKQATDAEKFAKLEDDSVWEDVAELQKEGVISKFTGPRDNPTFKTDADADRMEAVVDFMKEQNKLYLDMYNQGRPYKHIGFKEAYFMYDSKNPATPPAQKKEDDNRREVAAHLSVNRGLASKEFKRPIVKQGTRLQDVLARIDSQEEI